MSAQHCELDRALVPAEPGRLVQPHWRAAHHAAAPPQANVITQLPDGARVVSKCLPVSRFPVDAHFARRVVYLEWRVVRAASRLVETGRSPHFVRHYAAYVAPTRVPRLFGKRTPRWALYMVNEYCDGGDLEHWQMIHGPHSPDEWQSMMAQFLLGYAALSGALRVLHGDMHWGNLLCCQLVPGGYWWYVVRRGSARYDFFVPNTGQQWKIWDFGQSCVMPRHASPSLETFFRRWQAHDLENVLAGVWEFAHTASQHPVLRGECRHTIDALFDSSRPPSALDVLLALGWYRERPKGPLLNDKPFTIRME